MPGPLDGVLVVDLSRALAGPHAAMMLGDLGARVIKVENPDGGDGGLSLSWPAGKPQRGQSHVSGAWTWVSSAKLGLVS